jgi:hypothetical protein
MLTQFTDELFTFVENVADGLSVELPCTCQDGGHPDLYLCEHCDNWSAVVDDLLNYMTEGK